MKPVLMLILFMGYTHFFLGGSASTGQIMGFTIGVALGFFVYELVYELVYKLV